MSRRKLIPVALMATVALATPTGALADQAASGAGGVGVCSFTPGAIFSQAAKSPGSVAGHNSEWIWSAPGAPNAPGQTIKSSCLGV